MGNPLEYIVFEPDQVLTNNHLNNLFNYLDQQDRWTRNKTIGIGIACGFKLLKSTDNIEVTRGCGITSQGYLILQEDSVYTQCTVYSPVVQPNDLPFTYYANKDLPFYQPFCKNAKNTIYLLLTDEDAATLKASGNSKIDPVSSLTFLKDYVVVLFLEMSENDLKNCTTFDCNNKGEKMILQVRPLLVSKADIDTILYSPTLTNGPEIKLKRYNIPNTGDLNNSDDVLNAFLNITDNTTLQAVADAYKYCSQTLSGFAKRSLPLTPPIIQPLLKESVSQASPILSSMQKESGDLTTPIISFPPIVPLPILNLTYDQLIAFRDSIMPPLNSTSDGNPELIQYFYDFINDLVNAYYEFRNKVQQVACACSPDENLFSLHLTLGSADQNTTEITKDPYRQYFIPACLHSNQSGGVEELTFLFTRMTKMINEFSIQYMIYIEKLAMPGKAPFNPVIKITPSKYESFPLSVRAIPYYYLTTPGNFDNPQHFLTNPVYDINNYWNVDKTLSGTADLNHSYNAWIFNPGDDAIVNPLLYDIERFNFFRIEGHIGHDYTNVLASLLTQRRIYNLPFDVVAVSAELLSANKTDLPICNIEDLATDFRVLVSELAGRLVLPLCYLANLREDEKVTPFIQYKANATKLAGEPPVFMQTNYKLGDFISRHCNPAVNTLGNDYLQDIGYPNPTTSSIQAILAALDISGNFNLLYYVDIFFDSIERLMMLLLTNNLSSIDTATFTDTYDDYASSLGKLATILEPGVIKNYKHTFLFDIPGLLEELNALMSFCFDERLLALLEEYLRRLNLYNLQLSFKQYYNAHPGLEHKAGVPKGGTFVIVYHKATDINIINPLQEVTTETNVTTLDPINIALIRKLAEDCSSVTPAQKNQIIANLPPLEIPQSSYSLTDGEVIADFYIPYLCCSNCPPVAYIIPGTVQTKPTIKMKSGFCSDETASAISVAPSDPKGEVTDTENNLTKAISGSAGSFNFTPGLVFDDPTNKVNFLKDPVAISGNLVYKLSDGTSSDPLTAAVYRHPLADFTNQVTQGNDKFSFLGLKPDDVSDDFEYAWVVNFSNNKDNILNKKVAKNVPQLILSFEGSTTATVTLTVTNKLASSAGVTCSSTSTPLKIALKTTRTA
jgi:hypothetical protein